jgi:hypothetical protein
MTTRHRPHVPLPSSKLRSEAKVIALAPNEIADIASAARALPDPAELAEGTLVLVGATVREPKSIAKSVLAALGRAKTIPRWVRCSALVARGYVRVGASIDPDTKEDLVWGYAPPTTGPCSSP